MPKLWRSRNREMQKLQRNGCALHMPSLWLCRTLKGCDFNMANVSIIFKIMPENVEDDIQDLKNRIVQALEPAVKIRGVQVRPIAYGLNAINIAIITKDEDGASDKLEQKIREIKGVGDVQIEDVTLI
jgi:elongation factor 1-beta